MRRRLIGGLPVLLLVAASAVDAQLVLAGDGEIGIVAMPGESGPVRLAIDDFSTDLAKITGRTPRLVSSVAECPVHCAVVATVSNPASRAVLEGLLPGAVDEIEGRWEAYRVGTAPVGEGARRRNALVVSGSDERGTMFGLYHFAEEYLGVDPLYFWTEREPQRRRRLTWDRVALRGDEPTFRFRGWFLNDEDLLVEWKEGGGTRHIDYPYYGQVTAPEVHERVFESLLRLRMNLVIPASFNDIANPDEARAIELATRRGLHVSMHHVEPMGVSGFAFQNYFSRQGRSSEYSITKRPEAFEEIWRHYARLWAEYPNVVWQLGLRGIADRPIWTNDPGVPADDAARGRLISDAIATQWEIVRSVDPRPSPPATTTLWMEGARLHEEGFLRFPEGVAVIFADNTPGWQWQDDFQEVDRQPGRDYGVYYHHALWGEGPRFVQAVSPRRAYEMFGEAVDRGSTYYAMLNVGNIREFILGLDASARMLRDYGEFDPDHFMQRWASERFGDGAGEAVLAYRQLFDSFVTVPDLVVREKVQPEYPILLDGQAIRAGRRLYSRLLARATVPEAAVKLTDPDDLNALLRSAREQRRRLEEAGRLGERAAAAMEGPEKDLFQANFLAQQQIMLGLTRWVEAGVLATLAEHRGDRAEVARHARAGADAIRQLRQGQALAARGRFADWYRGDRKMDVKTAETATERLVQALQR